MYFCSTVSSVEAEQVLTETDVVVLMNLIHNFSDKWHEIGLGLGFAPSELNLISRNPSLFMSAPASFLTQLLSQWVQWPSVNHRTKPTLGALCETLRSSLVRLGSLAEEVEREMKCSTPKSRYLRYTYLNNTTISLNYNTSQNINALPIYICT